jgi:hypothetical protein
MVTKVSYMIVEDTNIKVIRPLRTLEPVRWRPYNSFYTIIPSSPSTKGVRSSWSRKIHPAIAKAVVALLADGALGRRAADPLDVARSSLRLRPARAATVARRWQRATRGATLRIRPRVPGRDGS